MKPKLLFVATKQPDYSRIKLLRSSLEAEYDVDCILSNASSYPGRVVEVCWRFMLKNKREYDLVIVGFFAQTIFPFIRFFWRGKLVSDCYISLYDSLIFDRARYSEKSLVAKLVHWLDGTLLRRSDRSLTDTKEHAEYLAKEFGVDHTCIVPIPISADESLFPFRPDAYQLYRRGDCFEVLFFGAFIPLQGTDVIVRAAKYLESESVKIHMLGAGQTYDETLALAKELGVENMEFTGWQPIERIPEMALKCDLLLGIFGVTEKAARVIPNKVFEALSLGRPVITGDSAATREFLTDGEDILSVPFGDPQALADKILWARDNHTRAVEIGLEGRKVFEAHLSATRVQEQLSAVVKSTLES